MRLGGRTRHVASRTVYAASVRLAVLVLVLAWMGACSDDKLGPMRAIKAEMCACKTAACADDAMKRVPPPAGSADHRAQKLAREIQDCLVKAYDRDRPTTDPDAETEPEPPDAR